MLRQIFRKDFNNMSKSAIYTALSNPTSVSSDAIIPLGATIRRFGCNILQDGNTISIKGRGYFLVNITITAAPAAVGTVTATLNKDGVQVTGATASSSVSTAANPIALPIVAIVRNACDCDSSILSLALSGEASTVQNVAVSVVKL